MKYAIGATDFTQKSNEECIERSRDGEREGGVGEKEEGEYLNTEKRMHWA